MEPKNDIERHVVGATVTHISPFRNLDVPVASTPIEPAVREKWVQPFYRASLFSGAEEFAKALKPIYGELSSDLIGQLLSQFNWRPRIAAAYFAAIRCDSLVQEHIGRLLLRSDVCFAGNGYCLALTRINTPEAADFLCRYLRCYLSKPDLWFDQEEAVGALLELDSKNGTNRFDLVADQFDAFRDNHKTTIEECCTRFRIQLDAIEFIHDVVCK